MATTPIFRRRGTAAEPPVELRFVDMLLIVIATLMFVAVVLSVTSAFSNQPTPPNPVTEPRIATTAAPTAIVGQDYRLTLAVRGGGGELRWRLLAGSLPNGLSLDPGGTVHGTPALRQDTRATVEVSDGTGRTDRRDLAFHTRPAGTGTRRPPTVLIPAKTSLIFATEDRNYRHTFSTSTGTPPFTWTLHGKLPENLQFRPDGTLSGKPAEVGTSAFTITVTDAEGTRARQEIRLVIEEGPPTTAEKLWDWTKKVLTVVGWLVFAWLLLFGIGGGERIPGLLDLFGAATRGRRREGR